MPKMAIRYSDSRASLDTFPLSHSGFDVVGWKIIDLARLADVNGTAIALLSGTALLSVSA